MQRQNVVKWVMILTGALITTWLVQYIALQFIFRTAAATSRRTLAVLPRASETVSSRQSNQVTPVATATMSSPDPAGKIVFTCTRDGFNHICTINPDGSGLIQLTSGHYNDYYGNFTHTGDLILFASNRSGVFQIYTMKPDGSQQTAIPVELSDMAAPDLAPDKRWIVFAATQGADTSLWLIRPDGSDLHYLYGPASDIDPSWSWQGDRIAFASNINGRVELFSIQPDGSGLSQITSGVDGIGGRSSWSPDDSQLVYYAGPAGDRDIYRVDIASHGSTRLTQGGNNAGPCFSPDGNWIIFASARDGDHELYIMRKDGSELRQITFNNDDDWQPRWGP